MYAVQLHEFGPPENLKFEELDDPEPSVGQMRIKVAAAGVHLIDTIFRSGRQQGASPPPRLPSVPGREVAGTVEAVGPGVDASWIGKRVVAHLGFAPHSGGYAELAVTSAESVHSVPDGLEPEMAIAMIGTGRTALAILELAQLTPNDVALVTAAAGGIGSLLVQAGLRAGARVVGAASGPEKVSQLRELGATFAVDYSKSDWPFSVRDMLGDAQITVALDGVGGELGRQAFELIGVGGRLIMFGFASGAPTPLSALDLYSQGVTVSAAIGARIQSWPGGLRRLEDEALAAVANGSLVPLVQCFPLAHAAEAHAAIERRATAGKVVLIP